MFNYKLSFVCLLRLTVFWALSDATVTSTELQGSVQCRAEKHIALILGSIRGSRPVATESEAKLRARHENSS